MPGTRAYSAHNHSPVNEPARWRSARSYTVLAMSGKRHDFDAGRTGAQFRPQERSNGLFAGRLGLDCQGMHARRKFSLQQLINFAMALESALAVKGVRNYFNSKMCPACSGGGARP